MKMVRFAAMAALMTCASAQASVISLDFENVFPDPNIFLANPHPILDYYDGGTSAEGFSGPNLGVSFSDSALVFCIDRSLAGCGGSNADKGGVGPASSRQGAIFLNGPAPQVTAIVNVAAGFETGFAFTYATLLDGAVELFSELDGGGTSLGFLALPTTPSTCKPGIEADYCPFVIQGLTFAGTAKSVALSGWTNSIVFDDLTFGAATIVSDVPEPAKWISMIAGFALAGLSLRRRRTTTRFA